MLIFRSKVLAESQIRSTIYNMVQARTTRLSQPANHQRIRLVLLDHHVLFRESLARLLASEEGFELVAECTTPVEALKSVKDREADVILVDAQLAKEFIPSARKARYPGKTLVIATEIDAASSAIVLKYGASGIFLASESSSRLLQAIRLVTHGEAWLDRKVIQLLAERYPNYEDRWFGTLRERERSVLQGIVDGLSNRKIGTQIGVSESTIKAILQSLFSKAGVRTRSQLVRMALERPAHDVTEIEIGASRSEPRNVTGNRSSPGVTS
jgi:DNA-binding NarL/FixJ family response regulator